MPVLVLVAEQQEERTERTAAACPTAAALAGPAIHPKADVVPVPSIPFPVGSSGSCHPAIAPSKAVATARLDVAADSIRRILQHS